MITFDGKIGIVTGAASGMGRSTAIGFAKAGGKVVIADLNEEGAKKVAAEIQGFGGTALAIGTDIMKREDIERMYDVTLEKFGRVDFVHNNAYGLPPHIVSGNRLGDVPDEVWDFKLHIGVTSVFQSCRRALTIMRKQGSGAIVNTASISGIQADYGSDAYAAGKAGVINLTRQAAIEYGTYGVRVNCVCPGPILTPLVAEVIKKLDLQAEYDRCVPMGRLGQPEEVANAVLFLASDLASFINGVALVADGGMGAWTGLPKFLKPGA